MILLESFAICGAETHELFNAAGTEAASRPDVGPSTCICFGD